MSTQHDGVGQQAYDVSSRDWTIVLFGFAAITGIAIQARGALIASFQREFGVSEAYLGLVAPVASAAVLATVLTVGFSAGRIDQRRWLLIGVGGSIIGFLLMAISPIYLIFLGMFGFRNLAAGVVSGLSRPLLSHLYPSRRGRIFNLNEMVWAFGAAIGPLLVTAVLLFGSWRWTYVLIAILMVPIFVALMFLRAPAQTSNERSFELRELPGLLDRPVITVMALSIVFTAGIEGVFFTWLPFYAGQFVSEGFANALLSLFLIAYVPGRFVFSRLVTRYRPTTLVFVSAIGSLLILSVVFTAPTRVSLPIGFAMVGFLVSGFFPTLLAWGTNEYPEISAPVNAIAVTAISAGMFTSPAIVGVIADVFSIEQAMFFQLALLGGLLILTLLGRRYVSRNG